MRVWVLAAACAAMLGCAAPAHAAPNPVVSLSEPDLVHMEIRGVAGTGSDDDPHVRVDIFMAGADVTSSTNKGLNADGSFSAAIPPGLDDGVWTVLATQYDRTGNQEGTATATFVIDKHAPYIRLTGPGEFTNQHAPQIEGEAGTEYGDDDTVQLDISGPVAETLATQSRSGAFSVLPPDDLPDGTYTVVASQQDDAGHTGVSNPLTFTVDTVTPVVALTSATVHGNTVTVSGRADDPTVDAVVDVVAGNRIVASTTVPAGAFTATLAVPPGDLTVRVIQTDRAGNPGVATQAIHVDSPPAAATPTPTPSPSPAPQPAVRKAAAALKISAAKLSRHGRTVTFTVRGTAARIATGKVVVTVGATKKSATLRQGRWTLTFKLRSPKKSFKLSASYAGDAAFSAASATKTVR